MRRMLLQIAIAALTQSLLLSLGSGAAFAESTGQFAKSDVRVVGSIDFGEKTKPVSYTGNPKYLAYEFNARAGYHLEVSADAVQGTVKIFLTDANYKVIAGGGTHYTYQVPDGTKPSTYFIVVQEASFQPTDITVDLEKPDQP